MNDTTKKAGPVSFFRALIGSCCGTAIFFQLRENSWLRVIWHLIIISFLCALGIIWGVSSRFQGPISTVEALFVEKFGDQIRFAATGITPVKEPERERILALPYDGLLAYLPEQGKFPLSSAELERLNFMLIWSPLRILEAVRYDADHWQVTSQQPRKTEGARANPLSPGVYMVNRVLSGGEFLSLLTTAGDSSTGRWTWGEDKDEEEVMSVRDIFAIVLSGFEGLLFLGYWGGGVLLALLYTAIFAGMFRLTGGGRLRRLTIGQFWKVGIYAGFPVMIVASCFPALDLPFLSYSMVFMIGLVIYWLIAVNRIEREEVADEQ